MNKPCIFSPCKKYRYTLWRDWDCDMFTGTADDLEHADEYLMVIGLNPSTADDTKDDPTIRRCIDFAKRWGYGSLLMMNLFAWRDTKPENMKLADDPVGRDNDEMLRSSAAGAGMVLAAWGKHGAHRGRANAITAMIPRLHALRLNKDGSPEHPLYIPATVKPRLYGDLLLELS